MPRYLSTNNGDGIICGCACGPNLYGEEIVFDLSGVIASCGCLEDPANPGTFYSLDALAYPSEFTMSYLGGSQWEVPLENVTYDAYIGTDSDCPDPTESTGLFLRVSASCQFNPDAPNPGDLKVLVTIAGTYTIYEGYFSALGQSAPSVNVCGQPTTGPLNFFALVSGGTGEISAPV